LAESSSFRVSTRSSVGFEMLPQLDAHLRTAYLVPRIQRWYNFISGVSPRHRVKEVGDFVKRRRSPRSFRKAYHFEAQASLNRDFEKVKFILSTGAISTMSPPSKPAPSVTTHDPHRLWDSRPIFSHVASST